MKNLLVFLLVSVIAIIFVRAIHLPDHILALLLVGLIPYTNISLPPLMMFFVWMLLPFMLFFAVYAVKGLYILGLIICEQLEYGYNNYLSHKTTTKRASRRRVYTKILKKQSKSIGRRWDKKFQRFLKKHVPALARQSHPRAKISKANNTP